MVKQWCNKYKNINCTNKILETHQGMIVNGFYLLL